MKIKVILLLAVAILTNACAQTSTVQNVNQPKNISINSNTNSSGNVLANLEKEREELLKKSENVKKDLDELKNKAQNANVQSESIQEKFKEIERDVNAAENNRK